MASIIISVETESGLTFNRVIALADADVLRILTAANDSYLGDKSQPGTEVLMGKVDDVFNRAVDIFFGEIRRMTYDYELQLAKSQAEISVAAIEEVA
jgi:hypothetical protein